MRVCVRGGVWVSELSGGLTDYRSSPKRGKTSTPPPTPPATPSPVHLHIVLSCQRQCEDVTISKRSQAARARAAARLKGEVTGVY